MSPKNNKISRSKSTESNFFSSICPGRTRCAKREVGHASHPDDAPSDHSSLDHQPVHGRPATHGNLFEGDAAETGDGTHLLRPCLLHADVCVGWRTVSYVLLRHGVVHLRASSGLKFRHRFLLFAQSNIEVPLSNTPVFFPDFLVLHVRQYHGLLRTSVWPSRRRHLHDPPQHIDQPGWKLAINTSSMVNNILRYNCLINFSIMQILL